MTTLTKVETTNKTGKRSTGPKTAKGKSIAKLNAVSHGLRSLSPVLPDECAKDWTGHRAGTVVALNPVGTLETELADRVALLTWRLRRVVRYETAVTAAGIDGAVGRVRGEEDETNPLRALFTSNSSGPRTYASVQKKLESARTRVDAFVEVRDQLCRLCALPADHSIKGEEAFSLLREVGAYTPNGHEQYIDIEDHEFLAEIGLPADWRADADWWDGWTAGIVRAGVKVVAGANGMTEAELIERAVTEADRAACEERRKATRLEALLAYKAEQIAGPEQVARGKALLPSAEVVDKVMRYEAHLNKQLTQTLHTLERLQAIRSGNPPAPPAALDVTVEAGH